MAKEHLQELTFLEFLPPCLGSALEGIDISSPRPSPSGTQYLAHLKKKKLEKKANGLVYASPYNTPGVAVENLYTVSGGGGGVTQYCIHPTNNR